MLKLSQLLETIQEGQIAQAEMADSFWYVISLSGHIWYWYPPEQTEIGFMTKFQDATVGTKVPLTYSNLQAYYTILEGEPSSFVQ